MSERKTNVPAKKTQYRMGAAGSKGDEEVENLGTLDFRLPQATSPNSIGFLRCAISQPARIRYLKGRPEWAHYCAARSISAWIGSVEMEWGRKPISYIIWSGGCSSFISNIGGNGIPNIRALGHGLIRFLKIRNPIRNVDKILLTKEAERKDTPLPALTSYGG